MSEGRSALSAWVVFLLREVVFAFLVKAVAVSRQSHVEKGERAGCPIFGATRPVLPGSGRRGVWSPLCSRCLACLLCHPHEETELGVSGAADLQEAKPGSEGGRNA